MDELKKLPLFVRINRSNLSLVQEKFDELKKLFSIKLNKVPSENFYNRNPRVVYLFLEPENILEKDLEAVLPEVQVR